MTLASPCRSPFPAALVTEARARHWLSVWCVRLAQEMRKANSSALEIAACEEHIAMAAIAVQVLSDD